ncbi:MAG: bifunctional diaminohydroxyphosphoribosylaminopyrimidine deaminase/5-amino-6-(5-phosphoribosylamino)uracil reductase RibD, partial [Burkholderiaceae bacterium]
MFSETDVDFMQKAISLAEHGFFTTTPNPRVGCLIVRDGKVVGQGWHEKAGEAHAEVMALRQAAGRARGATAYVTLEPCNHIGKTGPCTEALIQAGVRAVVAAMEDPNPIVAGKGLARLREAGLDVRCGLLAEQAASLNPGFILRMTKGRPWVRAKTACSMDGRVALANGVSQWITSPEARADGHAFRARSCLVVTGVGTVLQDDPLLNVRYVDTPRQPHRLVVDPRLMADPDARFFREPHAMVATTADLNNPIHREGIDRLAARGVEIISVVSQSGRPGDRLALHDLLRQLADRGMNEIHLEAGPALVGGFWSEGLIDEWLVYMAPLFLGQGMPPVSGMPELGSVEAALRWRLVG